MIRSLRTGVSGLKANQVRMDVIGNNIANVNTTAFKRGRASFNEMLGQQMLGVGRMSGGTGINPAFVGLGVSVGSIDQNWGQGALQTTNVATDLALTGDGFFVARQGDRNLVTRAGNFTFNQSGELVTANGLSVQGWEFGPNPVTGEIQLNTGALKDVRIDPNAQSPGKSTENIYAGGNLSVDFGILEDGTVDPTQTTSISAAVYDQRGKPQTVVIEFARQAAIGVGGATEDAWSFTIRDSEGNALNGPNALTFDAQGNLASIAGTAFDPTDPTTFAHAFTWDIDGNGAPETFDIHLGNRDGGLITQYSGSTTATVQDQDGYSAGTLVGYSIDPSGVLELNFSNGQQQELFQLAIGDVNNPQGLEQLGENFYGISSASGELQLKRAGRDLSTAVVAGSLEMSNVDLATEFTEMIVTQRGYQAAARVITTSDELLQETVQLKR